jgi:hypothetical protein
LRASVATSARDKYTPIRLNALLYSSAGLIPKPQT